ncbi:Nramp family divalent metal transporter [Glutamicibacter protophormiae]|uniref:Mn2+/Fe2+ NRAMP family transporter n=1 Tax=Glutamicibacter protophormiae TaxID=37930 RepID=A0ABS4XSW8_GLUPR|nr:Nramp family divalent metal transporter [Glutamicibacter protophormiae]MBP2399594.1 Mn2+/Fe2+ NRAMP family transporter [Glutamicibacter protophormiae]WPR66327.1 Nramp family divalent metal transporter [Glutamicibacter protophormiae]WPR69823.1 Nramp family divalent metal transporter [Glutamicibacter protophormiae]GGL87632.1 iron transporter [Glutamicibacter protophormiae]
MSESTRSLNADLDGGSPPKWKIVGPGLVVAATGVGAADMVATLVAGSQYGYALLWAVVLGVILKIVLVEGAGRYTLATGKTIFEGWRTLGRWTTWYFGPYIIIWGFVYGATAMSSAAMPLAALFPSIDLKIWSVLMGLAGFAMVWFGKYNFFEKVTAVLVGVMFVTVVGLAVIAAPNIPEMFSGLIPMIPEGGIVYTLALAGGVGGTITLAAYGYWLREKGWYTPKWMRVMRIDNTMAYVVTGIFVIAMLIVGAEVLRAAGVAISGGDKGLLELADVLRERYGVVVGNSFLVGFWAASFSSIIGVWNGVSLMFADFWGHMRKKPAGHPDTMTGGKYFKFYVLWLTFPPMVLFLLDKPIALILAYGVLGALFMPFLAVTLLGLLNGKRVPKQWANRWHTNGALAVTAILFIILGGQQLWKSLSPLFGG